MGLGRWLLCFPQPSFFLSGFSPQHALNNNNHLGFVYPLGLQKIHGFLKILSKICGLCIFLGKGVIDFIRLSLYNTTYPPFFKVLIWTRKISGCAEMECSKCKRKNLDTEEPLVPLRGQFLLQMAPLSPVSPVNWWTAGGHSPRVSKSSIELSRPLYFSPPYPPVRWVRWASRAGIILKTIWAENGTHFWTPLLLSPVQPGNCQVLWLSCYQTLEFIDY